MAIDHTQNQAALMTGGPLVVPAKSEPTYWNRSLLMGLAVGSMVPGVGTLIGGVIGSLFGKMRMEREAREGREVTGPAFWNKDTIIGIGAGNLIGALGGYVIGGGLLTVGVLTGTTPLVEAALPATLGGALTGIAVGGLLGARHGKNRLAQEYADAQQYVIADAQEREHASTRGVAPPRATTVTPEEAQLLNARMKDGPTEGRSYVQELAAKNPSIAARVGQPQ